MKASFHRALQNYLLKEVPSGKSNPRAGFEVFFKGESFVFIIKDKICDQCKWSLITGIMYLAIIMLI